MVNMMKLMKQAQSMQKNMENLQAELANREYEASTGGGMVKAVVKGSMSVSRIQIDPKVADPAEIEMLQDMVLSAVNTALENARADAAAEMSKVTGGLGIPGLM